jgi:hypothetical protein
MTVAGQLLGRRARRRGDSVRRCGPTFIRPGANWWSWGPSGAVIVAVDGCRATVERLIAFGAVPPPALIE